MFIYDTATCVFRSIIHYKNENSWTSCVRWNINDKKVCDERCEKIKEITSVHSS